MTDVREAGTDFLEVHPRRQRPMGNAKISCTGDEQPIEEVNTDRTLDRNVERRKIFDDVAQVPRLLSDRPEPIDDHVRALSEDADGAEHGDADSGQDGAEELHGGCG